jgi:hypothetical protein
MNTELTRIVYISGQNTPYVFSADDGANDLTDAQILECIAATDSSVRTDARLAWRQVEYNGEQVLSATYVPQAQTKG